MSYTVNQRTHEIGLRMALGARAGNVLRLVLAGAITAATAGVLVGLAATVWLTRLIKSQLYGVQPTDPGVLIVMTLAMVLVAAVAALVPAWRATRVNPMVTLRSE
jgi:putative ABC transport system permease protein